MNRTTLRDPWDEDLSILSTENVNFAVETAGLGSRFTAATIDLTVQGLIVTLLLLAAYIGMAYLPPLEGWSRWTKALVAAFLGILLFIVLWGYYFLFEWLWDGQTPGKRWLGLRVMQTSGMPITVWAALTRNLIRVADFLPALYGVGALIAIFNPNNRRAGDLIAGTIVAREHHDATRKVLSISEAADNFLAQAGISIKAATGLDVPAAIGLATPQGLEKMTTDAKAASPGTLQDRSGPSLAAPSVAAPSIATEPVPAPPDANVAVLLLRLDNQDQELLQDFLSRRDKLPATARARLAASLAVRLCYKLQIAPPPATHTEPFLESLGTALRGSQGPLTQPLQ